MSGSATSEITLAYIGGGSLNWAQVLMADLVHDGTVSGEIRLYDLDEEAARRNAALGERLSRAHGRNLRYKAVPKLAEALTGADFVVVSILPGSFEDMAQDLGLPEGEGVRQSVGDTVGPGGFLRAMRAIPQMAAIGEAIRAHAPQAYVCNLTNPMSVLTGALHAAYPGIRAWGECHEVTKLRHILAWLANRKAGEIRYDFRDVQANVLGVNHFTFVDRAFVGGEDMLPAYLAFAAEHRAKGWRPAPLDPENEVQRYFEDVNRVKFDLAARFGIAAAAGDRHLAEFLPASWYLGDNEGWGFGLTPVSWRRKDRDARRAAAREAQQTNEAPPLRAASEEALVAQIRALTRGETLVVNANLPNRGQLEGFAPGTIVETNALFSGLGVQAVAAGRLPPAVEALVKPHADRQNAVLAAVLAEDAPTLEGLFLSDPLNAPLGPDRAAGLFRAMAAATAERLPPALRRYG
ncbi:alpha-galactosidase [Neomegalonema sp.]|uniref:family 4 glycosyl hydrolase n=1 Tax=Neomegalonema sp. TaxID=2039713 RepID=UPI0026091D94|nr:alpha-galactosidase [Neomegalonema sp.]MDD2868312.1 alpha-galactosidase [Neomegalonema sp.]